MRIVVKGGVWKNTEDEILKAAISKYGKNQWARISSLLVRKTPKQCKARWYEWLDPSIKKTEWSTEEDEKLLHLAKLMPTQWRTIAPIVGRTANQCLERYQKLLDAAEAKDNEELGLTGAEGAEAGPSAEEVRRLRPGEVDPDPETKPARPDPIDMDEDEKEMLSEARARLANTQGKKAKRKARERQLEEARRLAMLQKKRELKAAGIIMRPKKKKGDMDYQADIPFEKQPAPGFYDTSEEQARSYTAPVGKTLRQLEAGGKRPHDDFPNSDAEQQRKRQKKGHEKDNAFVPERDNQIRKMKEEERIGRRGKLSLPEPQVGETELEEIVKIGRGGERRREIVMRGGADGEEGEDGDVDESGDRTRGMLGEYEAIERGKEMRTPRTELKHDNVMAEARNLRNRTLAQTPLMGEENTPMHDVQGRGTGYEGATPRHVVQATPNPLATPFRQSEEGGEPGGGETPGGATPVGRTPLRTPMRDRLGINDGTPGGTMIGATPREERMRLQGEKSKLQRAFASLPKAKNDFELVLPEEEESTEDEEGPRRIEDASERDERLRRDRDELERKELARRSEAVKRGLPRPVKLDGLEGHLLNALTEEAIADGSKSPLELDIERQVTVEMVRLLEHDAILHPVAGAKKLDPSKLPASTLEIIPDDELAVARELVRKDLGEKLGFPGGTEEAIKRALLTEIGMTGLGSDADREFIKTWQEARDEMAWDASRGEWVEGSTLSDEDLIVGMKALLNIDREKMAREAGKAAKTEKKLKMVLGGYKARFDNLKGKLDDSWEDMTATEIEIKSFEELERGEKGAMVRRVESLKDEVEKLERRERDGQGRYRTLADEKDSMEKTIAELEMLEAEAINEEALAAMDGQA